jgi:hypothetical protein
MRWKPQVLRQVTESVRLPTFELGYFNDQVHSTFVKPLGILDTANHYLAVTRTFLCGPPLLV